MTSPLARPLLDWYRTNTCDSTVQGAWHTLQRNGPLALTACTTAADRELVGAAMDVAAALVQSLDEVMRNPPPGFEVEFNGSTAKLLCDGALVYTKEI